MIIIKCTDNLDKFKWFQKKNWLSEERFCENLIREKSELVRTILRLTKQVKKQEEDQKTDLVKNIFRGKIVTGNGGIL